MAGFAVSALAHRVLACSQRVGPRKERERRMSEGVLTTLIGAITGLVIAVVTSFIIPFVQKRQQRTEEKRSIYERYAQPLAAEAVNLLWRLDEILFRQRGQYLKRDAPRTPFNEYKLISTCYRIAAVIGWIRAIRLEQSYLLFGEEASVDALRRAVVEFEAALADSPQVEAEVLQNLATLWELMLPAAEDASDRIAAYVVADLQHVLSDWSLVQYRDLLGVDAARQAELVARVADVLCNALQRPPLPRQLLAETWSRAIRILAVEQSWIYRDWQQAIGDMMILPVEGATRRYGVIGFGAFEAAYREDSSVWCGRLRDLVVGIDATSPEPSDFRLDQLRRVARAVAGIVCAIEGLDLHRQVLDPGACTLAKSFLVQAHGVASEAQSAT
jgi:hypothetical protein